MGRRSLADNNTRKLIRLGGGSIALTLPIEMVRELKWREKQKVTVKKVGKTLVIKDWKK